MKNIDMLYGFIIGLIATFVGSYLFIILFTSYSFQSGMEIMIHEGRLGKLITLGGVLNLISFFLLLKINKDMMAKGIILATITMAICTVFL
jgi:hypothetical protein